MEFTIFISPFTVTCFCSKCKQMCYETYTPRQNHDCWVVDEKYFVCDRCLPSSHVKSSKRPYWKLPVKAQFVNTERSIYKSIEEVRKYDFLWEDTWINYYERLFAYQKEWYLNQLDLEVWNKLKDGSQEKLLNITERMLVKSKF